MAMRSAVWVVVLMVGPFVRSGEQRTLELVWLDAHRLFADFERVRSEAEPIFRDLGVTVRWEVGADPRPADDAWLAQRQALVVGERQEDMRGDASVREIHRFLLRSLLCAACILVELPTGDFFRHWSPCHRIWLLREGNVWPR
jgi:hypothetical protein